MRPISSWPNNACIQNSDMRPSNPGTQSLSVAPDAAAHIARFHAARRVTARVRGGAIRRPLNASLRVQPAALLDQITATVLQRPERLVGRDRRDRLVVVPRSFRF